MKTDARSDHERAHGRFLVARGAESAWNWTTPAGQRRAKRRAALIIAEAGLEPSVSALEIGCGTGMFTEWFARTGAHIVAVDVSEDLIDMARERLLSFDHVEVRCGEFETLDLEGQFDSIMGSSVLHHLDVDRALRKTLALLKPRGRLVFAEPNMLNPQIFLERHARFLSMFDYVSADETAFVRWRLARKLRQVGFEDITVRPFDWLHPRTPPAAIRTVERIGLAVERVPGLREFSGSLLIAATRP
jgi:2-polyprenyl-3-methyl-5-hydroxy-6-metoxy-1,4-benzoquinol methylase